MKLASVSAKGRGDTDQLLSAVVARLQAEGIRVGGALRRQKTQGGASNCNSDLWLLPDGPNARITQDLGAGSTACRMDAGALEEAVGTATARLIAGKVDLVVLNKFGVSEAEGRGFRSLIVEALSRNVPVLIGVSAAHRAAFERFAGDMATALSPKENAVLAWCLSAAKSAASLAAEARVHDPTTQTPTVALIDHIWTRYHDTHRREMPGLIALACKVESAHAADPNTPHGLTDALGVMFAELEDHMRDDEETVFTALQSGSPTRAARAVPGLRKAHDDHEAALNRIAAITHGFRLPHYACQSWRCLYVGLGKLVEDLDEHFYLENEVLFPRIESRA